MSGDAGARALAQTCFDRPLLLEAGAGTGKTAVLIARIAAWCLGEGWRRNDRGAGDDATAREVLSRVAAITFTEAAAAEMASRVAGALGDIAAGRSALGVLDGTLPADAEARVRRARALRGALDHLTVRTIHAFCRRLLAVSPFEAGLHPRLTVDADGQRAALAAREVLEERLLAAFTRDVHADAFAVLADEKIGPADLESAVVKLLGDGAKPEDLAEEAIAPAAYAELARELAERIERLLAVEGGRLRGAKGIPGVRGALTDLASLRDGIARPGVDGAALVAARDAIDLRKARNRVTDWSKGRFGKTEEDLLGAHTDAFQQRARDLLLPLSHLARLAPEPLAAARTLLADLLGASWERLRAAGVVTYGSLLRDARDLLQEPFARTRFRAAYDQLLVDEFQDTDALQCELLASMALGGGPGPTLFVVGDPKQSIYGWRSADLRAYDAFRRRILDEGGAVALLTTSHRSVPPILAEVGRLVEPVMRAEEGVQPRFEALEASATRRGAKLFAAEGHTVVEHWLGVERVVEKNGVRWKVADSRKQCVREAAHAAADIARLHREHGVAYGDVAILLRATTELEPVLGALREAGVPFVVERETAFYQRREVIDLLALLRCVLDPHDLLALVAALRSSVVGVPDAALLPLFQVGLPERAERLGGGDEGALAAACAAVREAARRTPSEVPHIAAVSGWPAALESFLGGLDALRRVFHEGTADRFVEALRQRWLPEAAEAGRYLGAHRVANLDRVLRDLVEWSDELHGSPSQLLAALRRSGGLAREHEEGRPVAAEGDAVHVLTVHRAKGLDFGHVYLLQLHRANGSDPDPKPTRVRRGHSGVVGLELLGLVSPGAWRHEEARQRTEATERIRLLYVAATRAKERLVVSWGTDLDKVPEDPERAGCFGDLVAKRRGLELSGLAPERPRWQDGDGVLWRLLCSDPVPEALPEPGAEPRAPVTAAQIQRDAQLLARRREEAKARAGRPVQRRASELEHDDEAGGERALGGEGEAGAPERERRVAMLAGTAVHAALEQVDFAAPPEEAERAGRPALEAALAAHAGAADERDEARGLAREIWRETWRGPLAARFAALAPRLVARELPVLLAPQGDGPDDPVGFVAGAADCVYRAESGELVVVDYKTDRVAGEELRRRAATYAAQGRAYTNALARALGLPSPPRFELWFLRAGQVVS